MIITSSKKKFSDEKIYIFKKEFQGKKSGECTVNVSAMARYKLYIDNTLVFCGPQKPAEGERHYDTFSLTEYLKDGKNEIVIEVLQLKCSAEADERCLCSVYRTGDMYLALWGKYVDDEKEIILDTDSSWQVTIDNKREIISKGYVGANEVVYDANEYEWETAVEMGEAQPADAFNDPFGQYSKWYMMPRTISPLNLKMRCVNILPEKRDTYDAGEMTSGYVKIKFSGKGKLKIFYAECFSKIGEKGNKIKGDRTDILGDAVSGCFFDIIECDGEGEWESFWLRTFRYITVEAEGSATADYIYYIESSYPTAISVLNDFNNELDNKLWKISARTLQLCMQETYMDCPYYEQLQYAMDTYLQMLFTYQNSHDTKLAKNAIYLFKMSQGADGLTTSRYPCTITQIIPGFSLFYVLMVYEYYIRYGDKELVRDNINAIRDVLEAFEKVRGEHGLVSKSRYWNFVDWAKNWFIGIPKTEKDEPVAIYSLMYAYTLRKTAYLCDVMGYDGEIYLKRADEIVKIVNEACFSEEKGLYTNGPRKENFCQHMQVWAILTECVEEEKAKNILEKSFALEAKSTFAFDYFLLRALEKVGLYDKRADILKPYYGLIENNCTTIPETPFSDTRSECHAWGAIVLYEFTAKDLGVTWEKNKDTQVIRINPYINARNEAKGKVCTAFGDVFIEWKNAGKFSIELYMPENVKKVITLPNGDVMETTDSYALYEC